MLAALEAWEDAVQEAEEWRVKLLDLEAKLPDPDPEDEVGRAPHARSAKPPCFARTRRAACLVSASLQSRGPRPAGVAEALAAA